MNVIMKREYRLYKRSNGNYYLHNNSSGVQRSLGTKDNAEAKRLLEAENQACQSPALNLELGKVYLRNADPKMVKRIWQDAMDELATHGNEVSQKRCKRGFAAKEFNLIRNKPIRGKKVLMKYTQEQIPELVKQLFGKLFVERIRRKAGRSIAPEKFVTAPREYIIAAPKPTIESPIPSRCVALGLAENAGECQIDVFAHESEQSVVF